MRGRRQKRRNPACRLAARSKTCRFTGNDRFCLFPAPLHVSGAILKQKLGEFVKKSSTLAALACLAYLALNIYAEHSGLYIIDPVKKLVFAAGFCALWTLACRPYHAQATARRKKLWMGVMFLYYLWILSNMLFFDAALGRDAARSGVNLEPLLTIHNYLRAYRHGNISLELVMINLLGNLAAFAPMGVFLPSLFRSQRNLLVFVLTIVCMVAAAEGIQYLTATGSCDVDDLILNTVGAVSIWIILLPMRLLTRRRDNE